MSNDDNTPSSPGVPHSREAEEAVIGSVLINPDMFYFVSQHINSEDFYIHRNRWIWEAIAALSVSSIPLDLLTISDVLERGGKLSEIGGSSYLTSLINQVPTSLNAESYARIVKDSSVRRGLITAANKLASLAYSSDPIESVITSAQQAASKATARTSTKRSSGKQAASKAIDKVLNRPRRFTFGVENLDKELHGMFAERLYIWAGYQGAGKTAYNIQNARQNAELGFRVLDISLEMSVEQKWLRMACGDLGISYDMIEANLVDNDTRSEVINRAGQLGDLYEDTIVIYEAPMTLTDILAAVKTEQPDVVWIDHSRLISGVPKGMTSYEWAMEIPTFLRQEVAKMKGGECAVNLLMQLNRSSSKENRRPNMHDLRLGGEDDPDMVTLLHRPEVDPNMKSGLEIGQVPIKFYTDKNRFGWTGETDIIFDLPYQKFLKTEKFSPNKPSEKVIQRALNSAVGSED